GRSSAAIRASARAARRHRPHRRAAPGPRARPPPTAPVPGAAPRPRSAADGALAGPDRAPRSALPALAGAVFEAGDVAAQERQLAFAGQVALEAVELLAEIGHVLEGAVDRGETHIGNVVELAQLGHHELAHAPRGQLALGGHAQLVDDGADRGLDLLLGDRALVQRAVEALAQLARVEMLAAAIGLDDRRQLELHR